MGTAFHDLAGKPLYTEHSYPYEAKVGKCRTGVDSKVRIKTFNVIARGEENLRKAVGEYWICVSVNFCNLEYFTHIDPQEIDH